MLGNFGSFSGTFEWIISMYFLVKFPMYFTESLLQYCIYKWSMPQQTESFYGKVNIIWFVLELYPLGQRTIINILPTVFRGKGDSAHRNSSVDRSPQSYEA